MADAPDQARSEIPATGDRRQHTRLRAREVGSLVGEVMDLSPGGMQVHHVGRGQFEVNDAFDVVIWHSRHEFAATVRVAWCRKVGHHRQFLGLEFVGDTQGIQQPLQALAREACTEMTDPECWLAA